MRIVFHKLSDARHELEIVRADGSRERVACETRSVLLHDFLHYAVEAEAGLAVGFFGQVAAGTTLAEMNERAACAASSADRSALAVIERIVGALHGMTKGQSAGELFAGVERLATALGTELPPWVSAELIAGAAKRLRSVVGRWKKTPYGGAMDLPWPPTRLG